VTIAFTLAWRSLASRPARSFTAALGIAVGIATVLSVQVIDRNTILTQERLAAQQALGRPDVEIRPLAPGLPPGGAAPTAFAGDRDLESFCGLLFGAVSGARDGDAEKRELELAGVGPLAAGVFSAYEVAQGRDLAAADADEALLSAALAAELGWKIGDRVTLERLVATRRTCEEGKWVTTTLDGKAGATPAGPRAFVIVGLLARGGLGAGRRVVVPFESGAALFSDTPLLPLWLGRLRSDSLYEDLRERLKESFAVEKPKASLIGERIDQLAFRKSLRVTSCLALLLGLFVIYNAFSLALVERVREIGLLRAIGLKRGEIARAVLLEGLLLAILGALLGLLLAAGLVAFMMLRRITTLGAGKPITIVEIPWGLAALIVGLGMLFALFGMAAPLLRARSLSVLEALRAGRLALRTDPGFSLRVGTFLGVPLLFPMLYELSTPQLGERQGEVHRIVLTISVVIALFFVVLLAFPAPLQRLVELLVRPWRRALPVEARLAEAAVRGARQRIQGTLAGLSVVVAAVFIVRAVNDGFLGESARFAATALDGRVYVQNREMTRAQAETQLQLPEVARIVPLSVEVKAPFDLRAIDAAVVRANAARAGLSRLVVDEFARGETLLLSSFLAREYGWRVGDPVTLPTFGGAKTLRIGAITDAIGYLPDDRSFALIESGRMDHDFCLDGASARHWSLELIDGSDSGAVEAELRRRLPNAPDLKVRSDKTVTSFYLSDGRRDFYVFDVVLWSTAALAAVGLLNSLAIALLERRREIGLLRTLGLTSRQVGSMLLVEALAIGVVGGLLASALAWPLGKLAVDAVSVISRLDLVFAPGPALLAGPFVTCVTFALLAALGPALHGGRLDVAPLHRND
jgi:putative ABC transport system permease protein